MLAHQQDDYAIHPHEAVSIGPAGEHDLASVSQIAGHNFSTSRTYAALGKNLVAGFVERNSVENLRKKLHSGHHIFIVAKDQSSHRVVGFAVYKKLSKTTLLGTRMHVSSDAGRLQAGPAMHRFILQQMRKEGYELLYGDLSGESGTGISRGGRFLFVDSFANKRIRKARIDRVVIDAHARSGTAVAESAFIPLLTDPALYAEFLQNYGLVIERLFRKVERMHETGTSTITQSVFSHLKNGLELIAELRARLSEHLLAPLNWSEVETMWVFHDIGEIGLDADIPSYKKTRLDSRRESMKAARILGSISVRELRTNLLELHARYEQRKTSSGTPGKNTDREAAMCAFVDKLEAAIFIGHSGIGEVWKRRAGTWLFNRILKKHALGAFIAPVRELCEFLNPAGKDYLRKTLLEILAVYREKGLISKNFFNERSRAIAYACS